MRCGKLAICTALGCDINSIEAYQSTRCRGIFSDGSIYYTSVKEGKKPAGKGWTVVAGTEWFTRQHQIVVYQATQLDED